MTLLRSLFAAFLFALAVYPAAAQELASTRCRESEVVLDATHNAAKLEGCGDPTAANLLWHLDRIDQRDGILDGQYRRHDTGRGAVVYIMDTGVMAAHAEFALPAGSRVIAGFDATQSVTVGASTCASPNKALMPCFSTTNELVGASHGTSVASLVAGPGFLYDHSALLPIALVDAAVLIVFVLRDAYADRSDRSDRGDRY